MNAFYSIGPSDNLILYVNDKPIPVKENWRDVEYVVLSSKYSQYGNLIWVRADVKTKDGKVRRYTKKITRD